MSIIIKDLTTGQKYKSTRELALAAGGGKVTKKNADNMGARVVHNIRQHNGIYVAGKGGFPAANASLDGHKFEFIKKNNNNNTKENKTMKNTETTENNFRITLNKPIKKELTNARVNKTCARFLESLGIEIHSNDVPVHDKNTNEIYPSIAYAAEAIAKKSFIADSDIQTIKNFISKSCKSCKPVVVERNYNGCKDIIAKAGIEEHTFKYVSDYKVTELPEVRKAYKEAKKRESLEAIEELKRIREELQSLFDARDEYLIRIDAEMTNLMNLEKIAAARVKQCGVVVK